MGSAEGLSPFAGSLRLSLRDNFFPSSLQRAPEGWSKKFFSAPLGQPDPSKGADLHALARA